MPTRASVHPYIGSFPLAKETYQGLPRFSSNPSPHAAPDTPVDHQSQIADSSALADAQCRLSTCARAPICPCWCFDWCCSLPPLIIGSAPTITPSRSYSWIHSHYSL